MCVNAFPSVTARRMLMPVFNVSVCTCVGVVCVCGGVCALVCVRACVCDKVCS